MIEDMRMCIRPFAVWRMSVSFTNERYKMNTNNMNAALFGAIETHAESNGKGKGSSRCAILAEEGDKMAIAVVLAPSTCKSETRARVRVALRSLAQFPAKDADWSMGSVAQWANLPEAIRAQYADKIPAHEAVDTVYLVTASRKATATAEAQA